jgi:hypothetical protein
MRLPSRQQLAHPLHSRPGLPAALQHRCAAMKLLAYMMCCRCFPRMRVASGQQEALRLH